MLGKVLTFLVTSLLFMGKAQNNETNTDCSDFKDRCVDSQTRAYCSEGQIIIESCPSLLPKCEVITAQCIKPEDIFCNPETYPRKCLDEKYLRVCHHGLVQVVECQDPWPHCNNESNSCSFADTMCFDSVPQCKSETEVELCNALGTKEIIKCSPGTHCQLGFCVDGGPCNEYEVSSSCINETTIRYCTNKVVEYSSCSEDLPFCDPYINQCALNCDPQPRCVNATSLRICQNGTSQLTHCPQAAPFCDQERRACSECLESTCLNDTALLYCNNGRSENVQCQEPTPLCREGACTDSKLCSRDDYYTSCVNSSTLLSCFSGFKDYTVCSEPQPYCDIERGTCSIPPLGFKCPSIDGYYPDLKSCDTYHFCGDGNSTMYNCSSIAPGSLYDPNTHACSTRPQKKCHRFGCNSKFTSKYRVYRGDHSIYGLCGKANSVLAVFKCPEFHVFNETQQDCQPRRYECRKEGRIPDGNLGFFDCVMKPDKTFIQSAGKCPSGFYYSERLSRCSKL